MRSAVVDILPSKVKRALAKMGGDIAAARKKRRLTIAMMAERTGVAKSTYLKVEKGDPTVGMGIYAMTFFILGFDSALAEIVDAGRDETGMLLEAERLPKRVRIGKTRSSL